MILSVLAAVAVLAACAPAAPPRQPPASASAGIEAELSPEARRWVEETFASLSLRQKVGQMIVPGVAGDYLAVESDAYARLREWVVEQGIGGVSVGIGPPLEVASKLNLLQQAADIPLLVSANMEHGPGHRLLGGVILPYGLETGGGTGFPPLMAFGAAGDERLVYEMGRITALEGRAAGIHMTYAPVVDVNNNPANPIINTRSYGADPQEVGRLAAAHIRGLQEHGMLATAKHFPGHGDTGTDSHLELPVITVSRARADSVELVPFRAAADAGVAGVMSAHIAFPALSGNRVPATLSPEMLTGLLKEELGFDGLTVTDALDMGGIVNQYGEGEAAVLAVQAGADLLLKPPSVPAAINAIVVAVERGEISEERIDRSVRKLLRTKAALGLHRERTVDLARIPRIVGSRSHWAVAREVAERSITLARDRDVLLPMNPAGMGRVLSIVYSDNWNPLVGRTLQRALADRFPGMETAVLDARARPVELDSLLAQADSADLVLFSPFVRVMAWKGDAAIAEPVPGFVEQLAVRRPTVVVSFGSPYVLKQFPNIGTYLLAWGQGEVAQRAAVRALTGEIPITGTLPISLPPYHPIGTGIQREALTEGEQG